MGGRTFIVTQSIKKLCNKLQNKVFNDSNYKQLSNDKDISLDILKNFDRLDESNFNLYSDKAYKVIDVASNVDLGLLK